MDLDEKLFWFGVVIWLLVLPVTMIISDTYAKNIEDSIGFLLIGFSVFCLFPYGYLPLVDRLTEESKDV